MPNPRFIKMLGILLILLLPDNIFAQTDALKKTTEVAQSEPTENGPTKTKKRRPARTRRPKKSGSATQQSDSPASASYSPGPVASRRPGIFTAEAGLNSYYDSNFGQFSQRDFDAFANGAADARYATGTEKRFRISSLDDFVLEPSVSFSVRGRPLAERFAEATIYYIIAVPLLNSGYINHRPGISARHQIYKSLFGYGGFEFLPYIPGRNMPIHDDQGEIISYVEDWQKGYNLSIGLGYFIPKLLKVTAGYRFDWENHPTDFKERDGAAHNIVGNLLVYAWPPILKTSLDFGYRVYDCVGDLSTTETVEPSISSITLSYMLKLMAQVYDLKSTGDGELGLGIGQQIIDYTSPYDVDLSHKNRQDVVTEIGAYFRHSFGLGLILQLDYTNRGRVTNLANPVREETYEVTEFRQYQVGLRASYNFGSFGPPVGQSSSRSK